MNYAGVIGKNHTLSRHELTSAWATITDQSGLVVFFQYKNPDTHRAGLTKWGRVVSSRQLQEEIAEKKPKIIGCDDKNQALKWKRQYDSIKRIKVTEIVKTDYDIKTKGMEIITLGSDTYLVIDHYQNIPLYEAIDIHKPVSGMEIGMMPAKLTHLLLSIGVHTLQSLQSEISPTIRDPFTGFGTTNMLANALGYNTIGSDINITQAKKNIIRREKHTDTEKLRSENKITLRKHDVTDIFWPVFSHADVIVSEGRLGPIVTGKTHKPTLRLHAQKVADLYASFFANIEKMGGKMPSVIIMTIPEYDRYEESQPYELLLDMLSPSQSAHITTLSEVYRRKGQRVGRRIIICDTNQ